MSEPTKVDQRQNLQRRMAIQRGVELAMNEMIRDMQNLVKDNDDAIVKSDMEKHQLTNVLSVAIESPSVELVKNFILYQAGRDTRGSSWRRNKFGEALVGRLEKLRETAESIALEVNRAMSRSDKPSLAEIEEVWIELARQYIGQLNRYFYYRKEAQRW